MNWYHTVKHTEIVKTAAPICPVECPTCGSKLLVDAGERIDSFQSSRGNPVMGEQGQCFIRCDTCKKYSFLHWQEQMLNMAKVLDIRAAGNEEVLDKTRFDGVPLVRATLTSDAEYQDIISVLDFEHPIQSV